MKKFAIVPVLLGFFIMGFSDIVGAATAQIKDQCALSDTMANLIPSVVFVWFFFLSIPTVILMNKIGRKNTVILSNVVTFVGIILPFICRSMSDPLPVYLVAFALLGIGNTIIQVALNPLVTDVIAKERLSTGITIGQVIKAVAAFTGPYIIMFFTAKMGMPWIWVFAVYAVIDILVTLWLIFTRIDEARPTDADANASVMDSLKSSFSLLGNPYILACFFGIFAIVGVDVGMNVAAPKLLQERLLVDASVAGTASSWFFLFKTLGAFLGAFALTKIADLKYFRMNAVGVAAMIALLFFVQSELPLYIVICGVGFFEACIFGLIVSMAMKAVPGKENEASGLMITGIIGGALVSFLSGVVADAMGGQIGTLCVISVCALYVLLCPFLILNRKDESAVVE